MDCKLRAKNCGGCPLLGLDYAKQLKQKEATVKKLLEKALGDSATALLGERAAPDLLRLTPRTVSGAEMLQAVHAGGHCPGKCAGAGGQYAHAGAGAGRKPERCGGRCPGGAAPCRKAGHPDRCCRRRCRGGFVPHGAGC